jgi:hypothetical protein
MLRLEVNVTLIRPFPFHSAPVIPFRSITHMSLIQTLNPIICDTEDSLFTPVCRVIENKLRLWPL